MKKGVATQKTATASGVGVVFICISICIICCFVTSGKSDSVTVSCDATLGNGGVVTVTEFDLQDKMVGIPMWMPNTTVVFVQTAQGRIFRSANGGVDWTDLRYVFNETVGAITLIPTDKKTVIVRSPNRPTILWISQDYGQNWKVIETNVNVIWLIPHPRIPGLVAALARTSNYISVYATSNGRYTDWYSVANWTGGSIHWGVNPTILDVNTIKDDTLFMTQHTIFDPRIAFAQTYDLALRKFSGVSNSQGIISETVLEHVPAFFILNNIIFAAVLPSTTQPVIALYVSRDGATSKPPMKLARFPYESEEFTSNSFTILDASEGTTFIHVKDMNTRPRRGILHGTLYQSDAVDQLFTSSLDENVGDVHGRVDFVRLETVDGVYLANQVNIDGGIETVISYDGGGRWHRIPAPPGSQCRGKPDSSGQLGGCYLNLYGLTSGKIPFYSLPSAIGIIIAQGNVGSTLDMSTHPSDHVYISVDGGVTWRIIKDGSYTYEFGDHGALLLLARNDIPTNDILFSWNQGTTWNNCTYGNHKLKMDNIMSGKGSIYGSSTEFLGYGTNTLTETTVLIHYDFSSLHERECVADDYEYWEPKDPFEKLSTKNCILGKSIKYKRRKSERECHNGENFSRVDLIEICNCDDEDFACDFCFTQVGSNSKSKSESESKSKSESESKSKSGSESGSGLNCVLSEQCVTAGWRPEVEGAPEHCNGTFRMTRGYRKIEGDVCAETEYTKIKFGKSSNTIKCPNPNTTEIKADDGVGFRVAVIFYLILALVVIGAIVAAVVWRYRGDEIKARLAGYQRGSSPINASVQVTDSGNEGSSSSSEDI